MLLLPAIAFVVSCLVACGMAQRPMYAGSRPIGSPDLHSRFRETTSSSSSSSSVPGLGQRLGEDDSASSTNANVPVDALGDVDLVNRLNQWPREHRPFWLINAEAIEAQRNQNVNRAMGSRGNFNDLNEDGQVPSLPIRPAQPRSSFLSPSQ